MQQRSIKGFTKQDTLKAKGFAILFLVFHHMFRQPENTLKNVYLHFFTADALSAIATNARFCVWIYVFLSAYGITVSYTQDKKWISNKVQYFWHRVLSLWQFYLPFLLIEYIVLFITNPSSDLLTTPLYIITNIIGIADMLGYPMVSGIYWYISFTFVLILFFPLLYNLCLEYKYLVILIVSILQLGLLGSGIHSNGGVITFSTFPR